MSWHARWLDLCDLVASWSKDRSRHVGAVIVGERNTLLQIGWNGFPRGVDDEVEHRHDRPAKYHWTSHAEVNAITNAAAEGVRLRGATLYVRWHPCADCARAIIQAGIAEVIVGRGHERQAHDDRYGFDVAAEMLAEAGVKVTHWRAG